MGPNEQEKVDGPHEARKAARKQIKAGADLIKMMASGGFGITQEGEVPSQPELTVAEMAAAVGWRIVPASALLRTPTPCPGFATPSRPASTASSMG